MNWCRSISSMRLRQRRPLDPDAGEWLPEAEYMQRRGYRLWGDRWLPREEYEERRRDHEEAQKRRREDARQERIARAIEALVVAELRRAAKPEPEEQPATAQGPVVAVYASAKLLRNRATTSMTISDRCSMS